MNKKTLADGEARRRAVLDHEHTLLVEAGAGTGKTSLLAGRVAMLLANGTPPGEIVAITFTEAAAAELLERIHQYVTALSQRKIPKDLHNIISEPLSEKTIAQLKQSESRLSDLSCTTIHGFCQQILRPYPVESNIDPNAAIIEPAAAELVYSDLLKDWISEIFGRKSTNPNHTQTLPGSSDIFHEFLKRDRQQTLDQITNLGSFLKEHRMASASSIHVSIDDLRGFTEATRAFSSWYRNCGTVETKTEEIIADLEKVPELSSDLTLPLPINKLTDLFFSSKPKACLNKDVKFRVYKCKTVWKKVDKNSGESLNAEAATHYTNCEAAFARRYHALMALAYKAFVDQFDHLKTLYKTHKQKAAILDFDDLLYQTRDLLKAHPTVRSALAQRYKHILVDEFQDTDPIQAEIIWLLCGNGKGQSKWQKQSIRRGALFLVGDPKQAIYRFRGADVDTYLCAKQSLLKADKDCILNITTNFRSQPEILDFVNQHFDVLLSEEHNQPGFVPLSAARLNEINPNVATYLVDLAENHRKDGDNLILERIRKEEAQTVARLVADLLKSHQTLDDRTGQKRTLLPGDIALLAPTGTSLWIYEQALENLGIPIATQAGKGFFQRQEIHDLIAITRTLADSRDTLALGTLLRGPLVGLTEESIADEIELLKSNDSSARLYLWSNCGDLQNSVLRATLETLQQIAKKARHTTPYQLLSNAIELLKIRPIVYARNPNQADRVFANIERFLEMSKPYASRGMNEFSQAISQRWNDKDSEIEGRPDTSADAVSIITIHSSKGLEWPVVIPINTTTELFDRTDYLIRRSDESVHFKFFGYPSPEYDDVRSEELAQQQRERIRLWYVALTRAADLLLLPKQTERIDKDWFSLVNLELESLTVWDLPDDTSYLPPQEQHSKNPQDPETWEQEIKTITQSTKSITWHRPSRHDEDRPDSVVIPIKNENDLMESTSDELLKIKGGRIRGNILHKLMEEILNSELIPEEFSIQERARTLLVQLEQKDQKDPARGFSSQEMTQAILRTIQNPEVSFLLDTLIPEYPIYAGECEDQSIQLTSGIADAVALDASRNITTIIDWKSDVSPSPQQRENYLSQVKDYMKATCAKKGYIVYLTTGEIVTILSE
jgi:ATP-dependent exoDNAse (exonuclease V) beta subunit